ncbi:MAG: hypothetical protein ACQXXH_01635 [Candidatus Bathyarchaeia archaeon]|nr:hypothetical protein [Candidatus Bathyarchaeota archaeon A05DMB-4]MDH7596071.1 hypothetical protein [Candidatus Bathyarchaeota archaeon]
MNNNEWKEQKLFVEELKRQWKLMWRERIDDKVRAEGIAAKDFGLLFVERGTIIIATRDFKLLDFRQILQQHNLVHAEDVVFPSPSTGGWGKFAREVFGKNSGVKRRASYEKPKGGSGPLKKCGRGWLHVRM